MSGLSFVFWCRALARTLCFFFFNDTATTEIYTLSLHDALPISARSQWRSPIPMSSTSVPARMTLDRKSTRLNSSHHGISYAVFCLKKKNKLETLTDSDDEMLERVASHEVGHRA